MARINSLGPSVKRRRVWLPFVEMVTMYRCIGIRPFLGGVCIQRECRENSLHFMFARDGQLFSTLIRHAGSPLAAAVTVGSLAVTMITASFLALLVALIRSSGTFALPLLSAPMRAVLLPAVVASAYIENRLTTGAGTLIERNLGFHRDDAMKKTGLRCFFRSFYGRARQRPSIALWGSKLYTWASSFFVAARSSTFF